RPGCICPDEEEGGIRKQNGLKTVVYNHRISHKYPAALKLSANPVGAGLPAIIGEAGAMD
ncbi:hypothetical protein, partial [Pseudomonas putida]|uniref:hypothetical protein n=1 Tax=Pseudomonas putida TaxID=303 RepID=UPI00384F5446